MGLGLAPFAEAPPSVPPAAPTFFAEASNPADAGTLTGASVAVTPPASMQAGDLVVVTCQTKTLSLTWAVGTTGGQTWTTSNAGWGTSGKSMAQFWCTFNGTWSASPVFTCATAASNSTCVLQVFRPDLTTRVWALDTSFANSNVGAPAGPPYVVTRAGLTTAHSRTVALASWFVAAANTFTNLAGTGWISTPAAQYRNGALASSCAYALNAPAGAVVPTVTKEMSTSIVYGSSVQSWYAN